MLRISFPNRVLCTPVFLCSCISGFPIFDIIVEPKTNGIFLCQKCTPYPYLFISDFFSRFYNFEASNPIHILVGICFLLEPLLLKKGNFKVILIFIESWLRVSKSQKMSRVRILYFSNSINLIVVRFPKYCTILFHK